MTQLAYSTKQAAATLGISVSHFQRHVRPELRTTYVGDRVLFTHLELTRWLGRQA